MFTVKSFQDFQMAALHSGCQNNTQILFNENNQNGQVQRGSHPVRDSERVHKLCEIATKDQSAERREMAMRTLELEQPGIGDNNLNLDDEFVLSGWKERASL